MAEKKLTKKFGLKRDFKSEEKKTKNNTYMKKKTYKEPVKKQQKTTDEKCEPKKVASKKTEKSLCPVHGKCGGCQLLDMPYEKQLKKKQNLNKQHQQVKKMLLKLHLKLKRWNPLLMIKTKIIQRFPYQKVLLLLA